MLVIFHYAKRQKIYHLKKDEHIHFNYQGEYVIFHYNQNIEISAGLEYLKVKEYHYSFNKKDSYEPFDLYISLYDKNYSVFNRYKYSGRYISIGNYIDNDIYIQDENLEKFHLLIDTLDNKIINKNYPRCYSDDILCHKFSGVLTLLNMKMVINNDFIMVNSCLNIFVNLKKFNNISSEYVSDSKSIIVAKKYRNYYEYVFKEISLKKPPIHHTSQKNPLIFTIGPSLTMALASLSVGSISSYNAYVQGREFIEIIPMIILPLVMIISVLIWNPLQRKYDKKQNYREILKHKRLYKEYLDKTKNDIFVKYESYKNYLNDMFDEPSELIKSHLLFQKTSKDKDYLMLCLGIGNINSLVKIKNNNDNEEYDEMINSFMDEINEIKNCKVIYDILKYRHLCIVDKNSLFIFYLLFQLLIYYSYDEVKVALIADEKFIIENSYLLKINHFYDDLFINRMIAINQAEVIKLNNLIDDKTVVFVFNNDLYKYIEKKDYLIIQQCENITNIPNSCNAYILMDNFVGELFLKDINKINFRISDLNSINKNALYKFVSSHKLNTNKIGIVDEVISLKDIYSIDEITIKKNYESFSYNSLKVEIGKTINNNPITIDIHEFGNGPHGLIAGMTGSGKSEFIISLVCALCLKFSPKVLNIIIIDFKGGGIIQNFKNDNYVLPHIIGSISNLDEIILKKSIVSLRLEVIKRQKIFKEVSKQFNIPNMNIDIYQSLCADNSIIENLAHLLIIVDEFAELKKQEPEYMSELISIARIGRSLGIHLILATQKPSGIVDDQIWSNCRFKICLKVQDKQDSFEMIRINDASNIKKLGMFYMLCDEVISVGQCFYANALIEDNNHKVEVFNSLKEVVQTNKMKNTSYKTQLMELVSIINKVNKYHPSMLWLDDIDGLNMSMFDKSVYGVGDDFYNKKYLLLKPENTHLVIYSLNTYEKIKFLKIYLYSIIQDIKLHEIYIIDGLRCDLSCFNNSPYIIDIVNISDGEKVKKIINRCCEKINGFINNKITLIITHYPMFKERYDDLLVSFRNIIQDGEYNGINVMLFTTTFNTLNYFEHTLINKKICLLNDNRNEVSSIFDVNTKMICDKKGYGIIKHHELLRFKFFEISDDEICNSLKIYEGTSKLHILPFIKNNLKKSDYKGNEKPIGIDTETYQWITYSGELILTGIYDDLVYTFDNQQVYFNPVEINLNKKEVMNKPILWIGPGYLSQYIIPIVYKEELKENEGVYFYRGRSRKVVLAL